MAGNLVEKGDVMNVVLAASITSGTPKLLGLKLGIALESVVSAGNVQFALTGAWILPKAVGSGKGQLQGTAAYWDDTNKVMTNVSSGNTLVATAFELSGDNDTTAVYRLNP